MSVEIRSRLWSRGAAERLTLSHSQPTVSSSTGATPAPVQAAHGCVVSAGPTCDEVLSRNQVAIYRYAIHLTRNRAAADELYKETVLTAYRGFDRLDRSANHRAWLYRIATNAFRNRGQGSKEDSLVEESAEIVPAATGAARCEARALFQEVEAFVARLPLEQRIALIQRKFHDLSYTEIAASLRCSEATARSWVHQALRALRDHFGERL
jgi:RNA polymerase sigma-70 factor (ECF subfamily)